MHCRELLPDEQLEDGTLSRGQLLLVPGKQSAVCFEVLLRDWEPVSNFVLRRLGMPKCKRSIELHTWQILPNWDDGGGKLQRWPLLSRPDSASLVPVRQLLRSRIHLARTLPCRLLLPNSQHQTALC